MVTIGDLKLLVFLRAMERTCCLNHLIQKFPLLQIPKYASKRNQPQAKFDGLFNLYYQELRNVPHRRVISNEGPN